MWHLHTGRPERCVGGSDREDEIRREAARTGALVCESIITPEVCQLKLDEMASHRAEEAKRP
jgi:hypothetical protein